MGARDVDGLRSRGGAAPGVIHHIGERRGGPGGLAVNQRLVHLLLGAALEPRHELPLARGPAGGSQSGEGRSAGGALLNEGGPRSTRRGRVIATDSGPDIRLQCITAGLSRGAAFLEGVGGVGVAGRQVRRRSALPHMPQPGGNAGLERVSHDGLQSSHKHVHAVSRREGVRAHRQEGAVALHCCGAHMHAECLTLGLRHVAKDGSDALRPVRRRALGGEHRRSGREEPRGGRGETEEEGAVV